MGCHVTFHNAREGQCQWQSVTVDDDAVVDGYMSLFPFIFRVPIFLPFSSVFGVVIDMHKAKNAKVTPKVQVCALTYIEEEGKVSLEVSVTLSGNF